MYEESELNCCSRIINSLQEQVIWHADNEYDAAFAKNFTLKL